MNADSFSHFLDCITDAERQLVSSGVASADSKLIGMYLIISRNFISVFTRIPGYNVSADNKAL